MIKKWKILVIKKIECYEKVETKKFNEEKNKFKADSRVTSEMINLYYKVKFDMPENNIQSPIEILNNIEKYKLIFINYIKCTETKLI